MVVANCPTCGIFVPHIYHPDVARWKCQTCYGRLLALLEALMKELTYFCPNCGNALPCKHTISVQGRRQLQIYTDEILSLLRASSSEVWGEFVGDNGQDDEC